MSGWGFLLEISYRLLQQPCLALPLCTLQGYGGQSREITICRLCKSDIQSQIRGQRIAASLISNWLRQFSLSIMSCEIPSPSECLLVHLSCPPSLLSSLSSAFCSLTPSLCSGASSPIPAAFLLAFSRFPSFLPYGCLLLQHHPRVLLAPEQHYALSVYTDACNHYWFFCPSGIALGAQVPFADFLSPKPSPALAVRCRLLLQP